MFVHDSINYKSTKWFSEQNFVLYARVDSSSWDKKDYVICYEIRFVRVVFCGKFWFYKTAAVTKVFQKLKVVNESLWLNNSNISDPLEILSKFTLFYIYRVLSTKYNLIGLSTVFNLCLMIISFQNIVIREYNKCHFNLAS